MRIRTEPEKPVASSEDSVDEMLILAERLRRQNGGELDDSAIQAVSEATGAPLDYVRLAVKLRADKKSNFFGAMRAQFMTLEPETRRLVVAGMSGTGAAFLSILDRRMLMMTGVNYGFFSMAAIVVFLVGLYSTSVSRETRTAALSGAILTGALFFARSVFAALLFVPLNVSPFFLIPVAVLGACLGVLSMRLFDQNRKKLGFRDPVEERQELLAQLHSLKERLHSGAQALTFLSIDVVGSTRMKQGADPLAVEFTFNEYHQFVERITKTYNGRVHSTAGDGVICAFDHPQEAFGAARNMQSSLIELNLHRNKLGVPITVRCGIHTGTVVAPDASDVTTLNFTPVIDIASHLQKLTPPGGIAVSSSAADGLIGGMDAVGKTRAETEGVQAAIWCPRVSIAQVPVVPENA